MMTPRERVEAALLGRQADKVPFTTYYNKIFLSEMERDLRNKGLCIIEHRIPVFAVESPDVSEETIHYRDEDGIMRIKKVMQTPKGTLSEEYKQLPEHPRIPPSFCPGTRNTSSKARRITRSLSP